MQRIYNSGITREQFLFYEVKVLAGLLSQGYEKNNAINKIIEDNLFQFPTERTLKIIANGCLRRLEALDNDELVWCIANSSSDVGKQINLYAMACQNGIVYDFLNSVIGEKYRTLDFDYSKADLDKFILRLKEQNDAIASWSDNTINKIKQVLNKCLVECGYLDKTTSNHLNNVYLYPELENGIRANHDEALFAAFNYFE